MAKQCNACGGIYEPIGPDGLAYYHVCPPLTRVPVLRGGARRLVNAANLAPDDVIVVRRGDKKVQVAASAIAAGDIRLGDIYQERPDHRDETIVATTVKDKVVGIRRRDGTGATDVVVPPPDPFSVFDDSTPG